MRPFRTFLTVLSYAVIVAAALADVEWREGTVELSDGTKYEGRIRISEGKFKIYTAENKDFTTVWQEEVQTIETFVENERQEKKWIWKEDGRSFKIYTGETYPIRELKSRVAFPDGSKLEGRIYARTMHVKETEDAEPIKLLLQKQMEGRVGEKLDALVYVKKVTFKGGAVGVNGTISGRVSLPAGETFLKAQAINEEKRFVREGVIAAGAEFKIHGCTRGTYDLVVQTDKAYYVCFNREKDKGCARFGAGDLQRIHDWIMKMKDLWDDQQILYGGGNDEAAFVFVRMERRGVLQLDGPQGPVQLLRRYEVWSLEKPYEEWQITETGRLFIGRKLLADANDPPEQIIVAPQLGGHVIGLKTPEVVLDLKLGPNKEVVVPEARQRAEPDKAAGK